MGIGRERFWIFFFFNGNLGRKNCKFFGKIGIFLEKIWNFGGKNGGEIGISTGKNGYFLRGKWEFWWVKFWIFWGKRGKNWKFWQEKWEFCRRNVNFRPKLGFLGTKLGFRGETWERGNFGWKNRNFWGKI